ncbi:hypothetical protein PLEOSDRAFT_1090728 [Pleurotus ostreatus PC15]|uniref:Uncharacterized protein n=1 Tax=Pleurotus ostreatus (strain PC15) TaxID=1137138 RepID=A0A067NH41_PLEO1|nr:hypothetical protein PLEOSDRAFT_1090728 [Pleurotus ostreatus PC15]
MAAPVGNKLFHHHVLTTSPALDQFVISNPTSNEVITRTAAEIRNYIVIHHQAKSGNIPFAGGLPSDYLQFARAYNQEPNIWAKFAMPNANGSLIVSDRDPRTRNFGLEDDSLTQAFSAPLPVQHHTNNRNNHTNNRNNGVEERELFLQLLMSHANSTLSYNKKKAPGSHRHNPVATRSRPQGTILRTLVPAAAASVPVVSAAASTAVLGNSVTATIIANTTSGGESPTGNSKKKNLRKKRVAGKVTSAVEEGAADEMIVDYCEDLEGGPVASSSKA